LVILILHHHFLLFDRHRAQCTVWAE